MAQSPPSETHPSAPQSEPCYFNSIRFAFILLPVESLAADIPPRYRSVTFSSIPFSPTHDRLAVDTRHLSFIRYFD